MLDLNFDPHKFVCDDSIFPSLEKQKEIYEQRKLALLNEYDFLDESMTLEEMHKRIKLYEEEHPEKKKVVIKTKLDLEMDSLLAEIWNKD